MRRKSQYKEELTLLPRLHVNLLITVIPAFIFFFVVVGKLRI